MEEWQVMCQHYLICGTLGFDSRIWPIRDQCVHRTHRKCRFARIVQLRNKSNQL